MLYLNNTVSVLVNTKAGASPSNSKKKKKLGPLIVFNFSFHNDPCATIIIAPHQQVALPVYAVIWPQIIDRRPLFVVISDGLVCHCQRQSLRGNGSQYNR